MGISRVVLCGILALSGSATAQGVGGDTKAPAKSVQDDVERVPFVNPGDQIGIACTALTKSDAESDVRVVLTISAQPGDTATGYQKVLATDAQVGHGAVRVRIPTVPDLEDHLVNVDVYVMNNNVAQSCDAGHVKIVHQKISAGDLG